MGRPDKSHTESDQLGWANVPSLLCPHLGYKLGNLLVSLETYKHISDISFCQCGIGISLSPHHLVFWGLLEGLEIPYSSQIDFTPEGEKIGSHKFFSKFLWLPIAILYIIVMHQPNGIQKLKKKAALQHSRSEKLEIKNSNIYLLKVIFINFSKY